MPRPRQRVCLEAGFKLDLNKLMRQGCVVPGAYSAFRMCWRNSYTGEETASADMTANMMEQHEGNLRIQMGDLEQTIILTPRPRRFGGHQWYFMCPVRIVAVRFCGDHQARLSFRCRQGWGSRVAYASQFLDADHRAHRGKAKIKARLIGDCDPDEWELPPKPKWMRWSTYNRLVERFDSYEEILERGIARVDGQIVWKIFSIKSIRRT